MYDITSTHAARISQTAFDHFTSSTLNSYKPYRGINRWMTLITQKAMGYDEPRWLTYHQAEALGGHVRKDEKSTIIIF